MNANELLDLAEEIARRRHEHGIAIESLSDQLSPRYNHAPTDAVVQDTVESWAYTWLDYLQGGISKPDRSEALKLIDNVLPK